MLLQEGTTNVMTSAIEQTSKAPRTRTNRPECCKGYLRFLAGLLCVFTLITLILVFLSIKAERARSRRRARIIKEMLAQRKRETQRGHNQERKVATFKESKQKSTTAWHKAKTRIKSETTMETIWEDQQDTQGFVDIKDMGDVHVLERRLSLAPTPLKQCKLRKLSVAPTPLKQCKLTAHSLSFEKPELTKSENSRDYSREYSREYSHEYVPDSSARAPSGHKPIAHSVGKTLKGMKKTRTETYSDSLTSFRAPFEGRMPRSTGPTLSVKVTAPSLEGASGELFEGSQPNSKPIGSLQVTQMDSLPPSFTVKSTQE